jgi:aspartate aminotransferase
VFPDISDHLGGRIASSSDLSLFLMEQVGLATVPGDAFGEPDGIRLSYACSMTDLEEAVSRLKTGLAMLE